MRSILFLCFVPFLYGCGLEFPFPSSPTKAPEKIYLLVLGDSISTGFGLEHYEKGNNYSTENYGIQVAGVYGWDIGKTYVNMAVDGRTSGGLLEEISEDAACKAAIANAGSIVISVGGNDVMQPVIRMINEALGLSRDVSLSETMTAYLQNPNAIHDILTKLEASEQELQEIADQFAKNFKHMIIKIKDLNPDVRIYVLNVYNPFDGTSGMPARLQLAVQEAYRPVNQTIAEYESVTKGYTPVDVATAFAGNGGGLTGILSFDPHPSPAGHALIAELLRKKLVPLDSGE